MYRLRLTIAALLVISPFTANADQILITGTGTSDGAWEITLVEDTWNNLQPDLMAQEWWSDASLAVVFADAAQGLGAVNAQNFGFPFGPLFATDPQLFGFPDVFAACEVGVACGLFTTNGGVLDFPVIWATAERSSVPEPGTLALLGLGLAGVGMSRRKRKV